MSDPRENYEKLKALSRDLGFSLFGTADILPVRDEFLLDDKVRKKFNRGISLGKRLVDAVLEEIEDRPTPLYFHHYRQLNFFLDRGAFILTSSIQEMGYSALPIPASQVIDWENQRGHLSHKKIGYLAGLGWIGRNNLLINPEYGSRFRLVTILTDMPLEPDQPLQADCGRCRECLPVCPAGAIKEDAGLFHHLACFDKLKEFRRSGVVGQYICGICVKACRGPHQKRSGGGIGCQSR